jgi:hypothetical protein
MARPLLGSVDGDAGADLPAVPLPPPPPDPRLHTPIPVLWNDTVELDSPAAARAEDVAGLPPWERVKRRLFFWRAVKDRVQVSVFGPPEVTPGQSVNLTVYLHAPEVAACVRTLARATQTDAELLGTGLVSREVVRGTALAAHLSVANAGADRSLVRFVWHGRPHKIAVSLHVPWESPEGASAGLVSVGLANLRVGKIEFQLQVLPRRA